MFIINIHTYMTQSNTYLVIFVIAALVIAGGVLWYLASNSIPLIGNANSTAEGSQDTSGGTPPTTLLSYNKALQIYKDKRIQLSMLANNYCSVIPNNVVFRKGTDVMFDNRANKSMTFSLDGVKYTIKAYGFRIITLTTEAKLPHKVSLDCASGQNNATITLE